ncbi:hypothetical protein GCM10027168_07320 [Streptomyces capparidis]
MSSREPARADRMLCAAVPLLEADRQDRRGFGPALWALAPRESSAGRR